MAIYDFNKEKQDYTQAFYELLLSLLSSSGGNLDLSAPRLTLIGTVKLKIDELQPQKEGVQFIDISSTNISNVLDLYINGLLDEAAKHILQIAPRHVIIPTDGSSSVPVDNGDGTGYIILPDDYIRWVSFKMNTWLQEVTEPILTTDPMYKRQKYTYTRGGLAKPVCALNSIKKTNVAQKKKDTVTLSGTSGAGIISCAGVTGTVTFNASLTQTAADFVTNYAVDYAAVGVTVTSANEVISFEAAVAGVDFTSPFFVNNSGDLAGTTTHVQVNVPAVEGKRTIEYYSIKSQVAHVLSKFLYIGLVGAEYIQSNLVDALTWYCAGEVLEIMGDIQNQGGYAEKAMQRVQLSFSNLK